MAADGCVTSAIDSEWRFRERGCRGTSSASDLPWMPAIVPGHVHLDLLRNGVIGDPFYRMQERSCAWVDEADWEYETTFAAPEQLGGETLLVFRGLDTIAEIELNGELLGQTDNMFIPHEFPVGERLKFGEANHLRVLLRSALRIGRERQQEWTDAGNDSMPPEWFMWGPRSFVRKAQYMYGWDWGPELVSCGIWQPVEIVQIPVARITDWRYNVEIEGRARALVRVEVGVERAKSAGTEPLELRVSLFRRYSGERGETGQAVIPAGAGHDRVSLELQVADPYLWWPNGTVGRDTGREEDYFPNLYDLTLELRDEGWIQTVESPIGLRTVELVQEVDPEGTGFRFQVNGEDLFIKGANWIPMDSFPSRGPTHEPMSRRDPRVFRALCAAAEAGHNMLRIWGGGLYESEDFYDVCDSLGLLVWQDFPYGCAYYPDTGEYARAARVEATAAVRRLRNHPSLALWCGNNENDTMHHDGWAGPKKPARYLGEKIYQEVLPQVVESEDPGRPYWPSSPSGGNNPNSENSGDRHDWDVWHGIGDWTNYATDRSRFVSEFGFGASCGLAAWESCLAPGDRSPYSPSVLWHDKTRKGYEKYLDLVRIHFPDPLTLEDLVYYTQLNQAEAMRFGMEHWRRLKGRCWGLLYWQLNDCWPVQSWSAVDSEGEKKAALYSIHRAYAPILVSLVRSGTSVMAHVTNDLYVEAAGILHLSLRTFDGEARLEQQHPVTVPANGSGAMATVDCADVRGRERDVYLDARLELSPETRAAGLSARGTDELSIRLHPESLLFFAEPKDLRLADPGLKIEVDPDEDREAAWHVTVTARRLAPFTWLRAEGVEGWEGVEWSDNFAHVRPDRPWMLRIRAGDVVESIADLKAKLRVRSLR